MIVCVGVNHNLSNFLMKSSASCIHKHSSDIQDVNKVYTFHWINSMNQVHKTGLIWFSNSLTQWVLLNSQTGASSFFHPSAHDLEIDPSQPSWRTCQFSNYTTSREGTRKHSVERENQACDQLETRGKSDHATSTYLFIYINIFIKEKNISTLKYIYLIL